MSNHRYCGFGNGRKEDERFVFTHEIRKSGIICFPYYSYNSRFQLHFSLWSMTSVWWNLALVNAGIFSRLSMVGLEEDQRLLFLSSRWNPGFTFFGNIPMQMHALSGLPTNGTVIVWKWMESAWGIQVNNRINFTSGTECLHSVLRTVRNGMAAPLTRSSCPVLP